MKNTLIALTLLFAHSASAATLQLSGGETAVIEANVRTTVSCSADGGGPSCSQAAASFRATLAACNNQYGGGYCAETHWPKFKASYPSCAYAGVEACIESCTKQYGGGYCAAKCQ